MNLQLTTKSRAEVQRMAEALSTDVQADIAGDVDRYIDSHHATSFHSAAIDFLLQHYDGEAVAMVRDDDDLHIELDRVLRKLMVATALREHSLHDYLNRG